MTNEFMAGFVDAMPSARFAGSACGYAALALVVLLAMCLADMCLCGSRYPREEP